MDSSQITILELNQIKNISNHNINFKIHTFNTNEIMNLNIKSGSVYVYINSGSIQIKTEHLNCKMESKTYCAFSGSVSIQIFPNTVGIMIESDAFSPLNTVGGALEESGRLKYIDGCSDTLLLSPSRLGEPCLNLLHFPVSTNQTMHHHPSFRFGMVVSGEGESVSEKGTIALKAGDVFFIPPKIEHKFNTYEKEMNVIAFHPDSDWGPTDEIHPMKNRTWFS